MSKFCAYCGKEIDDGVKFCPFCGKASNLTVPPEQEQAEQTAQPKQEQAEQNAQPKQEQAERTAPPEQEQTREPSPQAQPVERGTARPDERSLSAKDLAARYCGNWITLVFADLLTLSVILNIISAVITLAASDYLTGAVNLLFMIGEIICCIGCWIVFSDTTGHRIKTGGLSVIRAGLLVPIILYSVFFGLICLVLIIYIVLMIGAADEIGSISFLTTDLAGSTLTTILIIFAVVVLIGILTICTYVGFRHTAESGIDVLSGRRGKWNVSMYAVVILIILAALNFIELLFVLILAGAVSSSGSAVLETLSDLFLGTDVLSILSIVLDLAVYVFAIIILLRIRHAFAQRSPVAAASDGR
ncbi:MAG: zinc-ribbon domain-containing protein [Oscillospiraceae bacterium]|nr:zinc-ribbon domain-containing protein [Oscillospiraceae bacterium]